MIDFHNFFHLLGGLVMAALVLYFGKKLKYGSRLGMALLAAGFINLLWEIFADLLHWLPFHAGTWDMMDIGRGLIGGGLMVMMHIIFWRDK